jgi:hypothetical protein
LDGSVINLGRNLVGISTRAYFARLDLDSEVVLVINLTARYNA